MIPDEELGFGLGISRSGFSLPWNQVGLRGGLEPARPLGKLGHGGRLTGPMLKK
jgi:hypothetical protein